MRPRSDRVTVRRAARSGVGGVENGIYLVVAALLALGAVFTVVGTVSDLIAGSHARAISDAGVFLLDRVLLLFIIAELLFTLRVVNFGGRIQVEPFLLIGLIAIVRKVLVITAEAQEPGSETSGFLIQIVALAGLTLVLAIAIYLLRRSRPQEPAENAD